MMKFCTLICTLIVTAASAFGNFDYKQPYGQRTPRELRSFMLYTKAAGSDLEAILVKAYDGNDEALGQFFAFSLQFKRLNTHARCYGQVVHDAFVELGAEGLLPRINKVLAQQPAPVKQRIRDIMYYEVTGLAPDARAAAEAALRKDYPWLFPAEFVFGQDDSVFGP